MEKSGASSYVYAKASGMLKKAFIGDNAVKLFNADSLSALWELIFKTQVPLIPETMLATKIEKDAVNLFVKEYIKLLDSFDRPSPFLIELLKSYETENIKAITSALSYGEENHPHCVNLGKYSSLHIEKWPDLKEMTEESEFKWIQKIPENASVRQQTDFQLDLNEIQSLWKSLKTVHDESKSVIFEYFSKELAINNLIWALRLKVYYNFSDEKIIENLYYVSEKAAASDPICAYAFDIFGRKTDSYDDWRNWKFAGYLNPHEEGAVWKINPMWIEQRFRTMAIGREKRIFHQYPMTDANLAMFFRLKQQELNYIRAATESLRLGSDKTEAMYIAGLSEKFEEGENG